MIPESKVRQVLEHPEDYVWSLQGFGMLRTYLDPDETTRLHIWDLDTSIPDVSNLHNHPWDFTSQIYFGTLLNYRFDVQKLDKDNFHELATHYASAIRTGEGGFIHGEPYQVSVNMRYSELLITGDTYKQEADEFHESYPTPGTVTVIERVFSKVRDEATTCWVLDKSWVSAEPRLATEAEVMSFIAKARARMVE